MQKLSLDALAREQLSAAERATVGRSARTVMGGHERTLRQTVIAIRAGHELAEHENPGEATLVVLRGRVRLVAGEDAWEGRAGDFLIVPNRAHRLEAVEHSAVLLSAVTIARPPR